MSYPQDDNDPSQRSCKSPVQQLVERMSRKEFDEAFGSLGTPGPTDYALGNKSVKGDAAMTPATPAGKGDL